MPTIIFLMIAYQIQNLKWRYAFLILAAINLVFNVVYGTWPQEIYAATVFLLLSLLNPCFVSWWSKRNQRNNPSSFWQLMRNTYQIAKHNKFEVFFWTSALIVSIAAVCFYTGYTEHALLGWLLILFLCLFIFKKLFYSVLPPEWFLHDINTGYVFLSVLIAWGASSLIFEDLTIHFLKPMLLTVLFCLMGIYFIRDNKRVLIPGCALVMADLVWQIMRFAQSDLLFTFDVMMAELVLVPVMVIGIIWLIKKPGILPIIYLALFQLFRFSAFTYEAIERVISGRLAVPETNYYMLYLVCWLYIVPLIFWFIGVMQIKLLPKLNQGLQETS